MAGAIWLNRRIYVFFRTVTVWQIDWQLAGLATFFRCGAQAMNLWAWNPVDVCTNTRQGMAKRLIDPAATLLAAGWLTLVTPSDAGMAEQLKERRYRVRLWSASPLRRPLAIVALSFIAAIGVRVTR
jgi:hypothetical protein